jgi:cyclophilin family peptidyl-prolyl cis-trans isomerase
MDKDTLPILALVAVVFLVGGYFVSQQMGQQRKAEVPAAQEGSTSTNAYGEGAQSLSEPGAAAPAETDTNSAAAEAAGQSESSMKAPNASDIDQSKTYYATLNTSAGTIRIKFNDEQTPVTVANFVNLGRAGFYDGTIFHRVIDGFMIQGGDPKGNGTGGPGYKFADEKFEGSYKRGTVAMANSGPNTNGSQFFIMHKDYPLPPNYTIFGEVVEGIEVVDTIATAETKAGGMGEKSTPVNPVKVESVQISEE